MATGFIGDYTAALGRRGRAVYGAVSLVVGMVTFLVSQDLGLALVAVLAGLLIASVLVAREYFERLRAATLDLAVSTGSLHGYELEPDEDGDDGGWVLAVSSVRITNRSPENRVSLGIRLLADVAGGYIVIGEEEGRSRKQPVSGPPLLETPLGIDPQKTKTGTLAFWLTPMFVGLVGNELRRAIDGKARKSASPRVEIEDYVSDRTITVPVPGGHPATGDA